MNNLQIKTGGPIVKEWVRQLTLAGLLIQQQVWLLGFVFPFQQQKLQEWQLAHPSGTAEECIEWMKEANSKRARTE